MAASVQATQGEGTNPCSVKFRRPDRVFKSLKPKRVALIAALFLSCAALASANEFPASIPLSGLNGINGTRFDGVAAGDNAGYAVDASGDINGDGFSDLIVGARTADSNGAESGSAYVVFGTPSGLPASLGLGLLNGSNGFEIVGESAADNLRRCRCDRRCQQRRVQRCHCWGGSGRDAVWSWRRLCDLRQGLGIWRRGQYPRHGRQDRVPHRR